MTTNQFIKANDFHFSGMFLHPNRKQLFIIYKDGEMRLVNYIYELLFASNPDDLQVVWIFHNRYSMAISFKLGELREYRKGK
jgi:hypothetical protein